MSAPDVTALDAIRPDGVPPPPLPLVEASRLADALIPEMRAQLAEHIVSRVDATGIVGIADALLGRLEDLGEALARDDAPKLAQAIERARGALSDVLVAVFEERP